MPSNNDKNYTGYWLKIAGYSCTVLITIIISMTGFWMMIGKDYITRDETRVIVENEMEKVENSLENHADILKKIDNSLEKNTNTIVDLKLSLTSLGSLDAMEKRLQFLESELRAVKEEQIKRTSNIRDIDEIKHEIRDIKVKISELQTSIRRSNGD